MQLSRLMRIRGEKQSRTKRVPDRRMTSHVDMDTDSGGTVWSTNYFDSRFPVCGNDDRDIHTGFPTGIRDMMTIVICIPGSL